MNFTTKNYNDNFTILLRRNSYKKETDVFVVYIYVISALALCLVLPNEHLSTILFYCAVILSAVMFAGLAQHSKTSLFFNIYMFFSFAVLYFIYGFRNFSGIDDSSYIRIFNNVNNVGWFNYFLDSTMEPGYLILNSLVSLFTDNYLYMQLIASFIPLAIIYYSFKKYRHLINIPTAVFLLCSMLYFQMVSVALVRMFIGISIIFGAFYYIPKRKPIKYILLVLLASLFHYSAFFMIFLSYFAINKDNLSRKASRITSVFFITSPFIFTLVAKLIVPLLGNRYSDYGSIEEVSISLSTFTTLPMLLLLLFFYKRFSNEHQLYFKLFLVIYSLSIIISLFSGMVDLGRLVFYSYSAFILGAAMVSKLLKRDSKKVIYYGLIVSYGFLYVYVTQFSLEHHIPYLFPYKNLFFTL